MTDSPQSDDAQDVVVGIVCYGCDILVCISPLGGIAGAGGVVGPGDCSESGENKDDGGVGYGFGACGGGVAVYDA